MKVQIYRITILFSHAVSLYVSPEILQKSINTKALLLGLQPKTIEFGEKIAPELRKTAGNIAKLPEHSKTLLT
ncbi:hypothetical protein KAU55_00905 [Candidatus Bathyarchaeota archaeon]|nr:hypothetical protein [Candidatus Bathyarchaeota archaeon]